ncbi:MAG: hypothetical protein QXJ06_01145 [Candidatus Aenigmatarchaeota archaeon]
MKGINFMIELAISISLLSMALFFIYKNHDQFNLINKYKFETFQALKILDQKNELRYYAIKDDGTNINSSLSNIIGNKFNFYVVIFNKTTNTTFIPDLKNDNVGVVDYHISGDFGSYSPRIIKVFIWV